MSGPAVEFARQAIADMGEAAGAHVGVNLVGADVAVHRFAAELPGYRGWEWHVVVACAPGSANPTVSEIALVPGDAALQAPEWVPYEQRVRPGDLARAIYCPPRSMMSA